MPNQLIVGPLLGLENGNVYTICFLAPLATTKAAVKVGNEEIAATRIAKLPHGTFWRAEAALEIPAGDTGRKESYTLLLDGKKAAGGHGRNHWSFYVPAAEEKPKMAYGSCNGVSKSDLLASLEKPFKLWDEMRAMHDENPFSLLLLGGDQLYADSIWDKVETLEEWAALSFEAQCTQKAGPAMRKEVEEFYSKLYTQRWSNESMSLMLASIPSVMMWDDHDIFDGWGSFPAALQTSPVFGAIFGIARKYFELYQIRSNKNGCLLARDGSHYSFVLKFRNFNVLALDNRSERGIAQVMSEAQWREVLGALKGIESGTLLVLSAVPVVYRDFSLTESVFDKTPWTENLTDDLKDHWRAKEHEGERSRLIMNLLDNARRRQEQDQGQGGRTVILSGDVHVGCLGVIHDRRESKPRMIHQVVSSGIVHPAPSYIAWLGIKAVTNDDLEIINEERTIEAYMLKPVGSDRYIRARNFTTLHEGTDDKLWVNWVVDSADRAGPVPNPVYPIV